MDRARFIKGQVFIYKKSQQGIRKVKTADLDQSTAWVGLEIVPNANPNPKKSL